MNITAGPLPNLKDILGISSINSKNNTLPWLNDTRNRTMLFYNRGMWAMREGIKIFLKEKGKKTGHIWIPDYFCNEALDPLRALSFNISFYPIEKDLSPNWCRMEHCLESQDRPDILILVHYFGFPNKIFEAEEFCKKHDLALLEDAAHVLVPTAHIGQNNVTIYSPRKLLPVPEGGLLVIPKEKKPYYIERQSDKEVSPETDTLFCIKWIVRSLLKVFVVRIRMPWAGFKNYLSSAKRNQGGISDDKYFLGRCASYTMRMLLVIGKNINTIAQKRRLNYLQLSGLLEDVKDVSLLFPFLPTDVCPYALPVLLTKEHDKVIQILNKHYSIPASDWPDIPPEVFQSEHKHETAIRLQKHIILLPIHQSLGRKHISYIANSLKNILNGKL